MNDHKNQLQNELLKAAKIADIEKMYALTKQGANINHPDESGKTACDYLAEFDYDKAIELLQRMVADIDAKSRKLARGEGALVK